MRVVELTALLVQIPLRREIRHASASRSESTNLLVRCRLDDGTEGWGEGVPRPYVTGETPEGAMEQLAATPPAEQLSGDFCDWPSAIRLCERFRPRPMRDDPRGCHGNALRCAVELSILDAAGRCFGQPLSAATQAFEPAACVRARSDRVWYSTTITAQSPRREAFGALSMRAYGFRQCKVKVGVAGADDPARVRRIRRLLGRRVDLRLDANEAWRADELVNHVEPLLPCNISCIEQPVAHEEVQRLAEFRRTLPVPIMLDESLASQIDAEAAIRQGTCDLFNIRLSKCGGFLNSLRLAAVARQAGLGYQLGCHPGESGILSAAGRHWACSVAGIRYLEGSYDRHLLRFLLTNEDITFGYGGRASALSRPGLGITIDPAALRRVTIRERIFRW